MIGDPGRRAVVESALGVRDARGELGPDLAGNSLRRLRESLSELRGNLRTGRIEPGLDLFLDLRSELGLILCDRASEILLRRSEPIADLRAQPLLELRAASLHLAKRLLVDRHQGGIILLAERLASRGGALFHQSQSGFPGRIPDLSPRFGLPLRERSAELLAEPGRHVGGGRLRSRGERPIDGAEPGIGRFGDPGLECCLGFAHSVPGAVRCPFPRERPRPGRGTRRRARARLRPGWAVRRLEPRVSDPTDGIGRRNGRSEGYVGGHGGGSRARPGGASQPRRERGPQVDRPGRLLCARPPRRSVHMVGPEVRRVLRDGHVPGRRAAWDRHDDHARHGAVARKLRPLGPDQVVPSLARRPRDLEPCVSPVVAEPRTSPWKMPSG